MSGTPNANGYIDLWAQYYLLDYGQRLGRYVTFYKQEFFIGFLINGYMVYKKPKTGAVEKAKKTSRTENITASFMKRR